MMLLMFLKIMNSYITDGKMVFNNFDKNQDNLMFPLKLTTATKLIMITIITSYMLTDRQTAHGSLPTSNHLFLIAFLTFPEIFIKISP